LGIPSVRFEFEILEERKEMRKLTLVGLITAFGLVMAPVTATAVNFIDVIWSSCSAAGCVGTGTNTITVSGTGTAVANVVMTLDATGIQGFGASVVWGPDDEVDMVAFNQGSRFLNVGYFAGGVLGPVGPHPPPVAGDVGPCGSTSPNDGDGCVTTWEGTSFAAPAAGLSLLVGTVTFLIKAPASDGVDIDVGALIPGVDAFLEGGTFLVIPFGGTGGTINLIPEPGTASLLGLGLIGLGLAGRRLRK
jgi:hypothetical protein